MDSDALSSQMTISNREFIRSLGLALLMLSVSALVLGTGYLILSPELASHKENATRPDPRPSTFKGSDLIARMGNGEATEEKYLAITKMEQGIDDRAIFSRRTNLKAADFPFLEYKITGRHPGEHFYFIWRRADSPEEVFNSTIHWAGDHASVIQLAANPDWQGTIIEIGLDVYGDLRDQAPVVEYLKLAPSQKSLLAKAIWNEWTVFREWTQRSAHHLRGTLETPILSPTLAMAAWAGLALLLLFFLARIKKQSGFVSYIIAVSIPWIALDMLWQSNLSKQLDETQYLFAGKTQSEKHLADWESDLYQYAQHLKKSVLPAPGVRIFLLNGEPHRTYKRLKLQYYLLPHNIFNFDQYPRPGSVQAEDYLITLGEIEGLKFNADTSRLAWSQHSLPVKRLDHGEHGSVYLYEGKR